jgi:hypothetical protein
MFVSLETPFRGVTAIGISSVRALLTALTDNTNMKRFAKNVKRGLFRGLP